MVTQLRRYAINLGKMDEFLEAWKNGVPHRGRVGGKAYYASPHRARLDPDPAQFIAGAETWFMTPILPKP